MKVGEKKDHTPQFAASNALRPLPVQNPKGEHDTSHLPIEAANKGKTDRVQYLWQHLK